MSIQSQVGIVEDPALRAIVMGGGLIVTIASVFVGLAVFVTDIVAKLHDLPTPAHFHWVDINWVGLNFLATAGVYLIAFCMPREDKAQAVAFYGTVLSLCVLLFVFVCKISLFVNFSWSL